MRIGLDIRLLMATALSFALANAPVGCMFFRSLDSLADGHDAGDVSLDASSDVATTDAAVDRAPSGPFCARAPHPFCADFEGAAVKEGWDYDDQDAGGTLTFSPLSPDPGAGAHSLHAQMPRRETERGYASLGKDFTGPWRHVVVEFDVYLESQAFKPGDSNAGLFCIGFYAGSSEDGLCLSVAEKTMSIGTEGRALRRDTWVHARFDMDPVSKTSKAVVDEVPLDATLTLPADSGSQRMLVQVGIMGYNVPAPAFSAYFDNVTIEFL